MKYIMKWHELIQMAFCVYFHDFQGLVWHPKMCVDLCYEYVYYFSILQLVYSGKIVPTESYRRVL